MNDFFYKILKNALYFMGVFILIKILISVYNGIVLFFKSMRCNIEIKNRPNVYKIKSILFRNIHR